MSSTAQAYQPMPAIAEPMSNRNFARLSAYIYDYSGIKMPETKKTMLAGRLARRMRALSVSSLDDYCTFVFDENNLETEGLFLINAVTTNKTDFFREPSHFDYLRETVLPEMQERGVTMVRAWSAACSTGPEPYTVAMVLDDFAEEHGGPSYGILATDLDTDVLEAARKGIYPAEVVDPVPERLLRKYVMTSRDTSLHSIRIVPALRSAIGFARLNLMSDRYPVGEAMHLIFCRNVLIYFDKPTQRKVLSHLIDCMRPDGYLFLGHSESIAGLDLPLKQVANTVFQRS